MLVEKAIFDAYGAGFEMLKDPRLIGKHNTATYFTSRRRSREERPHLATNIPGQYMTPKWRSVLLSENGQYGLDYLQDLDDRLLRI